MTDSIIQRITSIRQQLPPSVKLIAVTKGVSVEAMRVAYAAGLRDFGESRVQEASLKQTQLQDLSDITWHFIGHLQSNKASKALQHFQWIHSVDQLKLAQRLNELAADLPMPPQICLQVKMVPDPQKQGWTVPGLMTDLPALNDCQYLQIQGLMTICPWGLPEAETLEIFQGLKALATQIRGQNWSRLRMEQLSMGMSEDYHLALQAGATMVRLGRILFGERV